MLEQRGMCKGPEVGGRCGGARGQGTVVITGPVSQVRPQPGSLWRSGARSSGTVLGSCLCPPQFTQGPVVGDGLGGEERALGNLRFAGLARCLLVCHFEVRWCPLPGWWQRWEREGGGGSTDPDPHHLTGAGDGGGARGWGWDLIPAEQEGGGEAQVGGVRAGGLWGPRRRVRVQEEGHRAHRWGRQAGTAGSGLSDAAESSRLGLGARQRSALGRASRGR